MGECPETCLWNARKNAVLGMKRPVLSYARNLLNGAAAFPRDDGLVSPAP